MRYAGFWRQLAAVIIDQLIIWLPCTLLPQVYFYYAVANGQDTASASYYTEMTGLILLGVFFTAYYVILNGRYGVTVGRRLMNLKLVRVNQPNREGIGYFRAFERLLMFAVFGGFFRVSLISMIPLPLGLLIDAAASATLFWMLIDARRRTLEDAACGTAMVHDPQGKFPLFDPDKLPAAPVRLPGFGVAVVVYALVAWYLASHQ